MLAGSGNPRLSQAIAVELGVRLSPCHAHVFSEGNVFVQIQENVRGRDTFIIQGVHYPVNDNFVELLFWIDALKRASAQQVTVVIPFFSYAKGDKKDEPRVSIRARVCADAIEAAGADRVLTMDLHSPQIQGFFKIPVDHLYGRYVISAHVKSLELPNLVVCSPDTGFAKDASAYAQAFGRSRGDREQAADRPQRKGRGAGSHRRGEGEERANGRRFHDHRQLADQHGRIAKRRGAQDIYAAVTHGVLSKGAGPRLAASPIKRLFVTDTIETVQDPVPPNVSVISVANLFAKSIRSIHDRTSVSSLFPDTKAQGQK